MRSLSILFLFVMVILSTSVVARERLEERIKVVGTISSQTSSGTASAIVVMKDSATDKTYAVEVGKPFILDSKVYSVKTISKKAVLITDGVDLFALEHHDSDFVDPNYDEDQHEDEIYMLHAQEEREMEIMMGLEQEKQEEQELLDHYYDIEVADAVVEEEDEDEDYVYDDREFRPKYERNQQVSYNEYYDE